LFGQNKYFKYLEENESKLINELFTVNIGLMKLKNVGSISDMNPLDSEKALTSLIDVLGDVPSAKLKKKESVMKALKFYLQKCPSEKKNGVMSNIEILEKRLSLSETDSIDNSVVREIFLEYKKSAALQNIAKLWFENYENPFYILNASKKIVERQIVSDRAICDSIKANDSAFLDYLISGEIEKIGTVYVVTYYVYSRLLDKKIANLSVVSDSENLSRKVREEFSKVFPEIFNIDFGTLTVDATDDAKIFLDDEYIGKTTARLDFVIPGSYVLTVSKNDYEDIVQNVTVSNYEKKTVSIQPTQKKELQIVKFYIEPLGSKIFINSVYQGRTPFSKALPIGNYVISVKNDLFEDLRYSLKIDNIEKDEKIIAYHLKSKDINLNFKLKRTLYYVSFWNFTFSLITTIPTMIFAYHFFYLYGEAQTVYNVEHNITSSNLDEQYAYTEEGIKMKNAYVSTYAAAAVLIAYTGLSLGWMFYSLATYLNVLEKKDFIPILDFYKNEDGVDNLTFGVEIKLK
jgi:hypothetical protein